MAAKVFEKSAEETAFRAVLKEVYKNGKNSVAALWADAALSARFQETLYAFLLKDVLGSAAAGVKLRALCAFCGGEAETAQTEYTHETFIGLMSPITKGENKGAVRLDLFFKKGEAHFIPTLFAYVMNNILGDRFKKAVPDSLDRELEGEDGSMALGASLAGEENTERAVLGERVHSALGGDPENPFTVFEESKEIYAARREELRAWVKAQKAVEAEWRSANKELARKLDMFLAGELPAIDYKSIEMKADSATRAASATVLGVLAERVENMIVASADLSNSDKTDGFLKKTKAFTKGDFSGKFFQAGVSELTMACIMNGMALHGGVIPACGTFFVFSDYMKPAVRLSALMHLHVIYIWTHDSFRVGEDGPTHQPIEHEAQIRLMEHLRNHAGERSMVVLRPADGEETIAAWRLALEEKRPVALILSRQNIKNLPALAASRREEAAQLAKGAYIVADTAKPDVVMVASGSEVATLVEGAGLLAQEGIKARIVSVPSEGLFRDQPQSYQESVLPAGIARYGMTSGLPVTLQGLVGEKGFIHGHDMFGFSAPYTVLDKEFGYNGETVAAEVKKLLGRA